MKFLKLLPLILVCSIQSCIDLRSCPKNFSGKYVCENNPKAINYLTLNPNGTFFHFYKENNIILTDKGTWKKSEDGYCYIDLSNWKNFNELGQDFKVYGNGILYGSEEYLDISPDGKSSTSFKKK